MFLKSFNKPQSYIGIDLGAGGVKLVELKREKNHPVLFTYGIAEDVDLPLVNSIVVPEDPVMQKVHIKDVKQVPEAEAADPVLIEKYARVVHDLCVQAKTVSKVAIASLPISSVFHAVLTLPLVKKDELNHLVQAEIKKLLPLPIEDMVLDVQVISTETPEKTQHVLVNAVARSLVSFYTAVFSRDGITLDSLEPESMAMARSLVGKDPATTMIVDIGAERTNFFIVADMVPVTHHSTELGGSKITKLLTTLWGVDPALVEQMKSDVFTHLLTSGSAQSFISKDVFVEQFRSVIDPIAKEVEYSLELYMRQTMSRSKRIDKIILTGGAALFPYFGEYLAEKFKIKCYIGDPWGRVLYPDTLKPLIRSFGPRMSVAIGLALRNVV